MSKVKTDTKARLNRTIGDLNKMIEVAKRIAIQKAGRCCDDYTAILCENGFKETGIEIVIWFREAYEPDEFIGVRLVTWDEIEKGMK